MQLVIEYKDNLLLATLIHEGQKSTTVIDEKITFQLESLAEKEVTK